MTEEALLSVLGNVLADEIDAAAKEHRQNFPDGQWKEANIALGGLRKIALTFWPETRCKGNAETSSIIRAAISAGLSDHPAIKGETT